MNVAAALVLMLFARSPSGDSNVVVLRPEASNANVVTVGQTLVIPLYDGTIQSPMRYYEPGLRHLGPRRIRKHDLLQDLGTRAAFGGYDASSERGEAFIVTRPGRGSINVTLRLPQFHEACVSCRTVHFFYLAH
jgi:hypothetical protein